MDEHVIRTYVRAEQVFVEGEGCVLRDADGREWLDFLGGIAVSALGHGHPALVEALRDQVGRLLHVSNLYRHPHTEHVAGLLAEASGMQAVFFTNSGAEATECALKLARKHHELQGHGERNGYVAMQGGFHGRTMGALSVTSGAKYREPFEPLIPGVTFVDRGDIDGLRRALETKPAAFIIEPIQGEGGIFEHGDAFLQAAREACTETGTLLIHDEVQCGTGRTGRFLCGQHAGVEPDIATLAKPIAAGLPMGATLVRNGLEETLRPGDHGSTFAGGPLVLRAAGVVLEHLRDGLLDNIQARGTQLRAGFEALASEFDSIQELRGKGLMQALRLERGPELQKALYENGLITNCTAGDIVRFLPPYTVTSAEIDRALDIVRQSLRSMS